MKMADKKDDKKLKDEKKAVEDSDDIFGDMNDVLGKRAEAEAAPAPESDVSVKETPKEEKKSSHIRLPKKKKADVSNEATRVSEVAEKNMIWLTVGSITYTIDEISPEDFIKWVYDKVPGLEKRRKITKEQCETARLRIDIFEEVIGLLTSWQNAFIKPSDRNAF